MLADNFAFIALYLTPKGDELKLPGHLGAKGSLAESSRSRRSPQEVGLSLQLVMGNCRGSAGPGGRTLVESELWVRIQLGSVG